MQKEQRLGKNNQRITKMMGEALVKKMPHVHAFRHQLWLIDSTGP